ncbi:hypothetical protein Tco_1057158 [Tanacetum coccineum]|uniref:Uncharacterized protein n=1 Tax=Tanacetum coccineum TaxID=301880 RepID=A0ABQ5H4S9_9ASTR
MDGLLLFLDLTPRFSKLQARRRRGRMPTPERYLGLRTVCVSDYALQRNLSILIIFYMEDAVPLTIVLVYHLFLYLFYAGHLLEGFMVVVSATVPLTVGEVFLSPCHSNVLFLWYLLVVVAFLCPMIEQVEQIVVAVMEKSLEFVIRCLESSVGDKLSFIQVDLCKSAMKVECS